MFVLKPASIFMPARINTEGIVSYAWLLPFFHTCCLTHCFCLFLTLLCACLFGLFLTHVSRGHTRRINGPVRQQTIVTSPSVGAFTETYLTFDAEARSNVRSLVQLSFLGRMTVDVDEPLVVKLPNFNSENGLQSFTSQPLNAFYKVTWSRANSELSVFPGVIMPAGTTAGVSLNLTLPLGGVRRDDPIYTVAVQAAAGVVFPTPFRRVQPIGSFAGTPAVVFDPPVADSAVSIRVAFTSSHQILPQEVITLSFPNFVGDSFEDARVNTSSNTLLMLGSWSNSTGTISLTCTNGVAADQPVSILLSAFLGLRLPKRGLPPLAILITANNTLGPVAPTRVLRYAAIGSFLDSLNMSYATPVADRQSDLAFSFTATMPFSKGEVVTLSLPGFQGSSRDVSLTSQPVGVFSFGSWSRLQSALLLTVASDHPADMPVSLFLPGNVSFLRLPVNGTKANQVSLQASTRAVAGAVLAIPIKNTPAIGSFHRSPTVTFSPPKADATVNISLSFFTKMQVQQSETIQLLLPGFYICNTTITMNQTCPGTVSFRDLNMTFIEQSPPNVMGSATWDATSQIITFTVASTIQPDNTISLVIPQMAELRVWELVSADVHFCAPK
jgi:hypothetical protein